MILFFITFAISTLICVESQGNLQLSNIVYQMDEYCNTRDRRGGAGSRTSFAPPRVGKAGPRGLKGEPGTVNYNIISGMIQDKIGALERDVYSLKQNLPLHNKLMEALCPVKYNSNCFWAIKHSLTAPEGRLLCKAVGGRPAYIRDARHFDMILKYLSSILEGSTGDFWTGIDYSSPQPDQPGRPQPGQPGQPQPGQPGQPQPGQPGQPQPGQPGQPQPGQPGQPQPGQPGQPQPGQPGQPQPGQWPGATLPDGSQAPYIRWRSGYPKSRSAILIRVDRYYPNARTNGMWDYYPDKTEQGVICEI